MIPLLLHQSLQPPLPVAPSDDTERGNNTQSLRILILPEPSHCLKRSLSTGGNGSSCDGVSLLRLVRGSEFEAPTKGPKLAAFLKDVSHVPSCSLLRALPEHSRLGSSLACSLDMHMSLALRVITAVGCQHWPQQLRHEQL